MVSMANRAVVVSRFIFNVLWCIKVNDNRQLSKLGRKELVILVWHSTRRIGMKKTVLPLVLSTIWVSVSEFVRNEFLFKEYWTDHYSGMGLDFPDEPINGAVWGIWSLCFSIGLFALARKFNFRDTFMLGWFLGFVLMWLVTGNMGVLPLSILVYAIPLSWLEVFLAVLIVKRLGPSGGD